jgi:hypothetical protein
MVRNETDQARESGGVPLSLGLNPEWCTSAPSVGHTLAPATQAPSMQLAPGAQGALQPPQWFTSLCVSVQRLAQIARLPGQVHEPPAHEVGALQIVPQEPQLLSSWRGSRQVVPQRMNGALH